MQLVWACAILGTACLLACSNDNDGGISCVADGICQPACAADPDCAGGSSDAGVDGANEGTGGEGGSSGEDGSGDAGGSAGHPVGPESCLGLSMETDACQECCIEFGAYGAATGCECLIGSGDAPCDGITDLAECSACCQAQEGTSGIGMMSGGYCVCL